jgi:hypothetical protein
MKVHTIKAMLRACVVGLAASAAVLVGAGAASAAPVSTATHSNFGPGPGCSRFQLERWNLNGPNTVNAVYEGSTFTYTVTFRQRGSCLTGTLTDPYYPTTGPISGTVFGSYVRFSFAYPSGSIQGLRTFTGTINRRGAVSGTWSETGSEAGTGTWALGTSARPACPRFFWWYPVRYCPVR